MSKQISSQVAGQSILIDARDLMDNCKPPAYLIDGLIEEISTGAIIGDSGSGKTFIAADISASVSTGIDFCGSKTKQGQVVYMAGEGRQGFGRRLKAWEQERNKQIPHSQFIISKKTITLDKAGAKTLTEAVNEMNLNNVRLLVIDTLARHMDGEENSNSAMGDFINAVDSIRDHLGCAVIIIHHTGHGSDSKKRARGASSFYAALEMELLVQGKRGVRSIKGTKNKEGLLWDEHLFELKSVQIQGMKNHDGSPVTSAVVDWKGKAGGQTTSTRTKAQNNALNESQAALDACGTDKQVNGSNVRSIDFEAWRKYFYKTSTLDNDSKRATLNRYKNTLLDAELIEKNDNVFILASETKQDRNNIVTILRTLTET